MLRAFLVIPILSVLASCGSTSSSSPVDVPDELGPFAVGHAMFAAGDASRDGRTLPIEVWYPVEAEDTTAAMPRQYTLSGIPGPVSEVAFADAPVSPRRKHNLLVFSHGYQGISTQSIGLMEILASHGFIVASPEHTGNSQASPTDDFDEAAANRVPDVSFVIDTMLLRSEDPSDPFFDRVANNGIGVFGHSFGAMTAIGTAAGWAGAEADTRVEAILAVSAVIVPELQSDIRTSPNAGFTEGQLERITVPAMLMAGTEDVNVFPENNEIAFEQIVNAPHVYRVDLIGANHTHFANVCQIGDFLLEIGIDQEAWPTIGAEELIAPYEVTCGPEAFPIEEANRLQNLYTVAFFRRHLLEETGYDRFLSSEFAQLEPAINFYRK
jgi:predicted dienelactone hydrolase